MNEDRSRQRAHRKQRRGVSLGTLVALAITVAVSGTLAVLLPRFMGDTDIVIDTSRVFQALNLADTLPALELNNIPLIAAPSTQTTQPPAATSQPAQTLSLPTAMPVAGGSFTLTLGGSINMDNAVRQSGYYSDSKKYDFSETLSLLEPEFAGDLTLLTLENLIMPGEKVSELITPAEIMATMSAVGVDVVSLGFSQAYDRGIEGVASTVQAAQGAGLTLLGVYASAEDAAKPLMVTLHNVQVALLHYAESLSSRGQSTMKKEGNAFAVPLLEISAVQADIASAKARGAQVILVSVDWTSVNRSTPGKAQISLAQQLADAGADIIVGTGTGVPQPVTWLTSGSRRVLCAYSLGSLLNEGRKDGNVASLLLQLTLTCDAAGQIHFDRVAYTPTYIWRYRQDGKYFYRVVASDVSAPMGMEDDQARYKEKALANIQKLLGEDTSLELR